MPPGFLPETLAGWVALFLELFAVIAAIVAWTLKFIRDPLIEQLNGLGKRVKTTEETTAQHDGKLQSLERSDERTNFQVQAMAERQGKIEGRQEKLDDWLEAFERHVNESNSKTQERLSAIEAKLDMLLKRP